jgi:hypothetical protein
MSTAHDQAKCREKQCNEAPGSKQRYLSRLQCRSSLQMNKRELTFCNSLFGGGLAQTNGFPEFPWRCRALQKMFIAA